MNWYRLSRIIDETLNILGLLFPPWCYSFAQVTHLSSLTHTKQIRSQNSQVIWYHFSGLRYVRHTLLLTKVLHLLLWHSAHGPAATRIQVWKESRKKKITLLILCSSKGFLSIASTSTKPLVWIQSVCTAIWLQQSRQHDHHKTVRTPCS